MLDDTPDLQLAKGSVLPIVEPNPVSKSHLVVDLMIDEYIISMEFLGHQGDWTPSAQM